MVIGKLNWARYTARDLCVEFWIIIRGLYHHIPFVMLCMYEDISCSMENESTNITKQLVWGRVAFKYYYRARRSIFKPDH
jgi:hypothetical protein